MEHAGVIGKTVNRIQISFHSDNKEAVVNELKTFSQLIKDALDEIEEVRGVSKDQFTVTTWFHICTETEDILVCSGNSALLICRQSNERNIAHVMMFISCDLTHGSQLD